MEIFHKCFLFCMNKPFVFITKISHMQAVDQDPHRPSFLIIWWCILDEFIWFVCGVISTLLCQKSSLFKRFCGYEMSALSHTAIHQKNSLVSTFVSRPKCTGQPKSHVNKHSTAKHFPTRLHNTVRILWVGRLANGNHNYQLDCNP